MWLSSPLVEFLRELGDHCLDGIRGVMLFWVGVIDWGRLVLLVVGCHDLSCSQMTNMRGLLVIWNPTLVLVSISPCALAVLKKSQPAMCHLLPHLSDDSEMSLPLSDATIIVAVSGVPRDRSSRAIHMTHDGYEAPDESA
ncbi:hypothetical protein Tco_1301650 [Tanacetum coccineum]